jgi:hypothetical protein
MGIYSMKEASITHVLRGHVTSLTGPETEGEVYPVPSLHLRKKGETCGIDSHEWMLPGVNLRNPPSSLCSVRAVVGDGG